MADDNPATASVPIEAVTSKEQIGGRTVNPEGIEMERNCPAVGAMINDAIATLNEQGGSKFHAIKKYIAVIYNVDIEKLDPYLKKALKKGVESGSLTKPRGKGISGFFKLAIKMEPAKKLQGEEKVAIHPKDENLIKEVELTPVTASFTEASTVDSVPNPEASNLTAEKEAEAEPNVPEMDEAGAGQDPEDFLYLLRIDLVVEEILQNLSVRELKSLSSVSMDAMIAVRMSKVFSEKVRFRICKRSIRSRVLDNCFHSWKSVVFDLRNMSEKLVNCVPDSSTILQSLGSVKSFSILGRYPSGIKSSVTARREMNGFALKIIESSKQTLEYLQLARDCSFSLDEIGCIQFPNLKRLILPTYDTQGRVEEALLKNLPPLEELTVGTRFPAELIKGLQGRMSKLRKFHIRVDSYVYPDSSLSDENFDEGPTPACEVDWSMAQGMTSLEDIRVLLDDDCLGTCIEEVEHFFCSIPSKTVTKIFLEAAWEREEESSFSRKICEDISRFNNLTELHLHNLEHFDNDHLQEVIRSCPKLIKLDLEGLHKVTDFGVSGVKKTRTHCDDAPYFVLNEQGVPLTELRDLTTLRIVDCGDISFGTLMKVIRFEFLTSLRFVSGAENRKELSPKKLLFQILQQNPSLNEVDLQPIKTEGDYYNFDYNFAALVDKARKRFPLIGKLHFAYLNLEGSGDSESDYSGTEDDNYYDYPF